MGFRAQLRLSVLRVVHWLSSYHLLFHKTFICLFLSFTFEPRDCAGLHAWQLAAAEDLKKVGGCIVEYIILTSDVFVHPPAVCRKLRVLHAMDQRASVTDACPSM